ncbi:unnamed protein product [Protopolystoma xenopodis]|uniref:Uncharacterized protein n=1 Tax=Protopolystoma xenopodis TaxID=117903 RepID=A0A3S5BS66_9PLAT|nr:unnamed protein product [Protopolystoma xenopodis]
MRLPDSLPTCTDFTISSGLAILCRCPRLLIRLGISSPQASALTTLVVEHLNAKLGTISNMLLANRAITTLAVLDSVLRMMCD